MKVRLAALFCFLAFACIWLRAEEPRKIIITNANLVNPRTGQVEKNRTVVVKDGRIEAVSKLALIGKGHDLHIVNASGKYLIPGLWDMHVHSAFADTPGWSEDVLYPLYIANGIVGIRDMGGNLEVLQKRRQRTESGELAGPRLYFAGPFLDGSENDAQTRSIATPEEARKAVDEQKEKGVDFIKILDRASRESYFAIAEESAKDKISFVGHVPDVVSASEASKAGQKSLEHLSGILLACSSKESELRQQRLEARAKGDRVGLRNNLIQILATYDPAKAKTLFQEFVKNNTWEVPTLVWTRVNDNLDAPDLASDPRMKYVPVAVRPQWNQETLLKQVTPETRAVRKQEFPKYLEVAGSMQRAGVQFLAGSDGPDPYVFPGSGLHDELELLVKAGFTPAKALEAATYNPAVFMGKSDMGAIQQGYVADLVLLDANPLEDIRNTRKIDSVWIAGNRVTPK